MCHRLPSKLHSLLLAAMFFLSSLLPSSFLISTLVEHSEYVAGLGVTPPHSRKVVAVLFKEPGSWLFSARVKLSILYEPLILCVWLKQFSWINQLTQCSCSQVEQHARKLDETDAARGSSFLLSMILPQVPGQEIRILLLIMSSAHCFFSNIKIHL